MGDLVTKESPEYTVVIVDDKTTYHINPILISIEMSENENEMAQKAVLSIDNVQIDGKWTTSIFHVRQRVFIYANDGEKKDEVFRGFIWTTDYTSSNSERDFKLICFDDLIYFNESEDYIYVSSGKKTEDILKKIAGDWGVKFKYDYKSITHEKLAVKGTLSNIFMEDLLDKVRDKTGKKYVIRMEKDTLHVVTVGENKTIYQILSKANACETRTEETMDGMITKVIIFGKQGEGTRAPVEATVEGNAKKYGTLQKVVSKNEGSSLADAKKEAEKLVYLHKYPFFNYEVVAPDIPWLRKGDVVYINAGGIYQKYLIIKSISRRISNKEGARMVLQLNDGVVREYQSQHLSGTISSETPKQDAATGGASSGGGTINDGKVSASQQAVINAAYSTPSAGYNMCAKWVTWVFSKVGISIGDNGNDMTNAYCHSSNRSQLKPGMIIGCVRSPFGSAGAMYGHIAVYVGNNTVLSCELGNVARYSVDGFISTYGPPGGSQVRWGWAGNRPLS